MAELAIGTLLIPVGLTTVISYFLAWVYRNDYHPKKMLMAYGGYFIPLVVLGLILHLHLVLIIGIYLFGLIVGLFRNNYYFNE
ncbi:hypothetical protein IGI37_003769 [Enterococcus sp. AZ194]|uniref:hypothetical protein n=1 Tax=Enterococcus sp. AZ194 TaxID=2774629 RepID=UPI003F25D4B8